ncbi:MAG: hypothetical protein DWQ36_04145, partial [Acidobacteria bacterium]
MTSRRIAWLSTVAAWWLATTGLTAQAPPTRADTATLQRSIVVDRLARGLDASAQVEELLATPNALRQGRQPPTAASLASSELTDSVRALRRVLDQPGTSDRAVQQASAAVAEAVSRREAELEAIALQLQEAGIEGRPAQRLAAAQARLSAIERALEAIPVDAGAPSRSQAAAALEALHDPIGTASVQTWQPPILGARLPYEPATAQATPPTVEPTITPSYASPSGSAPAPDDLAGTALAPLAPEIVELAEGLGFDPVRVFEFVRNEIRTEWYFGAMKGALATLRQRAGNATDQSALLVALLRASSLPARFVQGAVEIELAPLADLLDLPPEHDEQGLELLRRAGVPASPVVRGGRLHAVRFETTWVAARVPYANYRGVPIDRSGEAWLPLAPWVKSLDGARPTGIARQAAPGVANRVAEYLAGHQPVPPLPQLVADVESWLADNGGGALTDHLDERSVAQSSLGLLPNSLPFDVFATTYEGARLPAGLLHRVRIAVRRPAGPALIDHEAPLFELASRRIAISFLPATLEDQQAAHLFGGLYRTPAYLIDVRPQLLVGGARHQVGETAIRLGVPLELDVEIHPPGSDLVRRSAALLSGVYASLALSAQRVLDEEIEAALTPSVEERESVGGRVLAHQALRYVARWDEGERLLADLFASSLVRPHPSLAVASLALTPEVAFGVTERLRIDGVNLDALGRSAGFLVPDAPALEPDLLLFSGLHGSALERFVFEQQLGVLSISADSGLGLAADRGLPSASVDAASLPGVLPSLSHPQHVIDHVAAQVAEGHTVTLPLAPLQVADWTGSVWRALDPTTQAAGYFLSGGLAGGATAQTPADWALQFLADALEGLGEDPNSDPTATHTLTKIGETDRQRGIVGTDLPTTLSVMARDASGRPVVGAPVTFSSSAAEASLVVEGTQVGPVFTVLSGPNGIASIGLRLGLHTATDPVDVESSDGLEPTRALFHSIDAWADSSAGRVYVPEPFSAFGLPDTPAALRWLDGTPTQVSDVRLGYWADTLHVAVVDQHENPISNLPIQFTATAVEEADLTPCTNLNPDFEPPAVFRPSECPEIRDRRPGLCGSPSLEVPSRAPSIAVGLIAGSSSVHVNHLTVEVPSVGSLVEPLTARFDPGFEIGTLHDGTTVCLPRDLASVQINSAHAVNSFDENIQAVDLGLLGSRTYPGPIQIALMTLEHDLRAVPLGNGEWEVEVLTSGRYIAADGELTLGVSNGGSADPPALTGSFPEDALYETRLTAGPSPGPNDLSVTVTRLRTRYPIFNTQTGVFEYQVQLETLDPPFTENDVNSVWGVTATLQHQGGVVSLNDDGRSTAPIVFTYGWTPSTYRGLAAEIVLLEDGDELLAQPIDARQPQGTASLSPGITFDTAREYTAVLRLNRGTDSVVVSDPVPVPLTQPLLRDVKPTLFLAQEVDVLGERVFPMADTFQWTLNQPAEVEIRLRRVSAQTPEGGFVLEPEQSVYQQVLPPGPHQHLLTPGEVGVGTHLFEVVATATETGAVERAEGRVTFEMRVRDRAAVGHAMVKGVNLFDGHLTLSRQDLELPGRGVPLAFQRTFTGNHSNAPGPLGVGWSHNYDSRVIVTAHGEALVIGAEGGAMRFTAAGGGAWTPGRGYHGTLRSNLDDSSFDFFARNGNRYHYHFDGAALGGSGVWPLQFIEDPSGNRTTLHYDGAGSERRLAQVRDGAGRRFDFAWEQRDFAAHIHWVITSVSATGGQSVAFGYDDLGNLISARREGDVRVEQYEPAGDPADALGWLLRHQIGRVHNAVNGAETSYEYQLGAVGVQGEVQVASAFVTRLTEPEGGETHFTYDFVALADRDAGLEVLVEDGRRQTTTFRLNGYGSPTRIEDPLGDAAEMAWDDLDILVVERTDDNGVVTTFEYDQHGNLTRETVSDGSTTLERTSTYWPPSTFSPPNGAVIKNRVATRIDRNGYLTSFAYDHLGNLVSESLDVVDVDGGASTLLTTHTYFPNGDRASTTDANGNTTTFAYDAYGNLERATNAEGEVTTIVSNQRSLPIAAVDPRGHQTRFEYDALNRLVRTQLPRVDGEDAELLVLYDDAANTKTEIDAEGRATTTEYDLEGRAVRITNPAGGVRVYEYDAEGNKTLESTWFDGQTPRLDVRFEYDPAGRLSRRIEPLGRVTDYEYDGVGNLVRETLLDLVDTQFASRVTEYEVDLLNRRTGERRLGGGAGDPEMRTAYDGEGNVVTRIDALGRTTFNSYDAANRLVETRGPPWRTGGPPKTMRRLYDGVGNLIEERTLNQRLPLPAGAGSDWLDHHQVTTMAYDRANRLVERIDGEGHPTVFEYDEAGNRITEIDGRLSRVEHQYDERNRRTRTSQLVSLATGAELPGSPIRLHTTFEYDRAGNLVAETHPNGNRIEHDHDPLDRLLRSEDELGLLAEYEYDARGNRILERDANGNETRVTFDDLDRVTLRELPEDRSESFTYDAADNRTAATDPRGHVTTYEHDRLDRLVLTRLPPVGTGLGGGGPPAPDTTSAT